MLGWLKSLAKVVDDRLYGAYVLSLRAQGVIDYPVPPRSGMRKTSSRSYRHFYESGIRTAGPIAYAVIDQRGSFSGLDVLDFGCGVGRQLLQLSRHYPLNRYSACDIDRYSVDYISSHYPGVNACVNSFRPPLPFESNSFDVIYSVSIFSHLNPDDQLLWLKELARVIRPGGLVLLTTEGRVALSSLAHTLGIDQSEIGQRLEDEGVLFKEYEASVYRKVSGALEHVALGLGIEGSYGSTVVSPGYVRKQWQRDGLQVLNVVEGVIDHRQDLVVLVKQ